MINNTYFTFNKNGTPYCSQFKESYFIDELGIIKNNQIFIEGNNVFNRLTNDKTTTGNKNELTIAETGFGCGLNFLLTLHAYLDVKSTKLTLGDESPLPLLQFISVEKFPLTKADLKVALATFPDLSFLSQMLISQYPSGEPKDFPSQCTFSFFDSSVILKLMFLDATQALATLNPPKSGLIDIWYLDGFSPESNPEMWSDELFQQIARLSKDQASLTTSADTTVIRRRLVEVGFRFQVESASDNKEKLVAKFQQNKFLGKGYQLRPHIKKPESVIIIGGGIASACAAYSLTKQGVNVVLLCKDARVAQGASSNAIGALYPLLHQQADDISEFYQQAFWHAKKLYNEVLAKGHTFSHDWCGLLDISYKEALNKRQQVFQQSNVWPHELIHSINQQEASKLAGISLKHGGLFMPHAGWVSPPELVEQLFEAAKSTNRLKIETNIEVQSILQLANNDWQINTDKGIYTQHILIVCGGAEMLKINIVNQLPLTSVRGQITSMKTNNTINKLSTVLCHKGYLTPVSKDIHCIGATFDKDDFDIQSRPQDDLYNINMLNECLPEITDWSVSDIASSKARLRCMTPDHLPMVGPMPNINMHLETYPHLSTDKNWKYNDAAPMITNLYVMTGFGARGLCSAPLVADILTADICGTHYPVDSKTLFNLSPNRFVIRDMIKRKALLKINP